MKRKSSIVKLTLIGVAIILGFLLAFVPIKIGLKDYNGYASNIKLGLDLKGGVYAVYEATANDTNVDFDNAMTSTITSLTQLLQDKGYEATLVREGNNKIRVSVPDIDDPQEILRILGSPADILFRMQDTGETILTGRDVDRAESVYDQKSQGYAVSLMLSSTGAQKFADATSDANKGKIIEIVTISNGEETVISSPKVENQIKDGQAVITGMRTEEDAAQLAQQIEAGKFSLTLTRREVSTVGATLGENALRYGLIAGIIGIALIIAILIYLYGLFGVASSIAMLAYTMLMLLVLALFPWVQLTLPGIAGILLSIGMAIDGNIIICERVKDEYRNGKSILSSMHYGYRKSISAILDGNITTILAAIVLLILGTGPVQGFATTLLIGIVLALFSSLVMTRGLMRYMVNLNQHNPNVYMLKRGEGYESLGADQNDAKTEMMILDDERRKQEKKNKEQSLDGGNN